VHGNLSDSFIIITAVMCVHCANLFQNLSVEAKVEATIQLEIDRLAAENLVRCSCFCHFKL